MKLFESRKSKEIKSHIKNLVHIACVDGSFDDCERELIIKIAQETGLKQDEINKIIDKPEKIKFKAPKDFDQKLLQLYDAISVMAVDGVIDDNEYSYCSKLAEMYGFGDNIREDIVDIYGRGIMCNETKEKIIARIKNKFKF